MMSLCDNLAAAWHEKAVRADAEIRQALAAPAFFKPEYIEEREQVIRKSMAERNRWTLEAMS